MRSAAPAELHYDCNRLFSSTGNTVCSRASQRGGRQVAQRYARVGERQAEISSVLFLFLVSMWNSKKWGIGRTARPIGFRIPGEQCVSEFCN